jgi:phosphohistidine phosphatase
MNLYLLRHASAGTRRVNPLVDAKRPLDKEGKKQCLLLGNALVAMGVQFDLIISSPLKRALQTASLVGTETGYEQTIQLSDAIAPSATFASFQRMIEGYLERDNILIVGHDPNISAFAGRLIAASDASRPPAIRMRKGSIAKFNLDHGRVNLQWLLDPRTVKTLYSSSTKRSRRKTSRK